MDVPVLLSATRILKNRRFLRAHAPELVDPELAKARGMKVLSATQLRHVHDPARRASLALTKVQTEALRPLTFEARSVSSYEDLFSGVIHVVDLGFRVMADGSIYRVDPADIATVIAYAALACGPINAYASQYGPNSLSVNPNPLPGMVDVPTKEYSDGWVSNWVNTLVQQFNIPSGDCLCILNPVPMVNTDGALTDGVGGYHSLADVPYLFVNIRDTSGLPLTVDDRRSRYANALSHEMAEMVVDSRADLGNPEVCDPCAGNCANLFLNCFKQTGEFVGSVDGMSFTFPFDFFIAAVVQPDFADQCPAPKPSCAYWPEIWSPLSGPVLKQVNAAIDQARSLQIFGLGEDGVAYQIGQTNGEWSGWSSLLGNDLRQLYVAGNDDGRLELFALGGDRTIYHRWQTPPLNAWGPWQGLGGADLRSISVLLDGARRLTLLALNGKGAVSFVAQTGASQGWGQWQPLDGHDLRQINAVVDAKARLVLLGLGGDGKAYFRRREETGDWTPWGGIPGAQLSQIAVSKDSGGRLMLFGTGTDKRAWLSAQDSEGLAWAAWTSLQGNQLKAVISVPNDDGRLELFSMGGNNRAYHRWQSADGTWVDWVGLGASQWVEFQQLLPILNSAGEIEVLGLSSSGTVFQITQKGRNGGWS